MAFLDKLGRPYTPMTEAEKQVHRDAPYPEGFTERSHMMERRQAQLRTEKPIEHVYEERPAPISKTGPTTTKRRVNVRRGR